MTDVPDFVTAYYLVKLNSDGTNVFTKTIRRSNPTLSATFTGAIAFDDAAGNAYVVGGMLLGGDNAPSLVATFVTKFSPTGTQLADQPSPESAMKLPPGTSPSRQTGRWSLLGQYMSGLRIADTILTTGKPGLNGFIAALNPADLTANRAFTFDGGRSSIASIDVTSTGAYRVAGYTGNGCVIGGMTIGDTTRPADPGASPFVAELAADTGAAAWVQVVSGKGDVWDTSINAADSDVRRRPD